MTTSPRTDRRSFCGQIAGLTALSLLPRTSFAMPSPVDPSPTSNPISLAQWSLHRAIFSGSLDPLRFPEVTMTRYGLAGCEYVNAFYKDKIGTKGYLAKLKKVADDHGVESLLIMCDGEGALGDADEKKRIEAVDNHKRWLEAAKFLGCHSIRVNAYSTGTWEEQLDRAADGLRRDSPRWPRATDSTSWSRTMAGSPPTGAWLAQVMKRVDRPNCGTLPDFGNFDLGGGVLYDRYQGVEELMPFAKAVSAKSRAFKKDGEETETDFRRMMKIVQAAKFEGWVGIEWEGGLPPNTTASCSPSDCSRRCGCRAEDRRRPVRGRRSVGCLMKPKFDGSWPTSGRISA